MKLKFKDQQYQTDAVNSIVSCFDGEINDSKIKLFDRYKYIKDKGTLFEKEVEVVKKSYCNHDITLSDKTRRDNITKVEQANDLNITDKEPLDEFTIEMETGTGKTFTYIKTMYELNKNYGWSKFIVMTPSIAIREGVLKSFEITKDFFQGEYGKQIRYFVYNSSNSSNIANISSFAEDNNINVMIINYQAFNARGAANRRIFMELDELQSNRPIDVIKSTKPILIIDEPQKFGPKAEDTLQEFDPLFIIRYSATHKKDFNKVYRLDAIDAYNEKLVKKINVKGIEVLHDKSESTYMFLDHVDISKSDPVAIMEIEVKSKNGEPRKVLKKIHNGDDLYQLSNELQEYKGYIVSEIDARNDSYDTVEFTNGFSIKSGEAVGNIDNNYLARIQIRETIRSHFEKEEDLFNHGIKVLSLFFLDEVKHYRDYDMEDTKGEYAHIFEEEYQNILNEKINLFNEDTSYGKYLRMFSPEQVHQGYFSVDKKGHAINSHVSKSEDSEGAISDDQDAYDLIMKNKERLLSFDEPVRFIFSHSALREGWDNPNIFQICTLREGGTTISRRQEIGRGLRIAVNSDGERMDYSKLGNDFFKVNTLTVVAGESYSTFANALQSEILDTVKSRPKAFTSEVFKGRKFINKETGKEKIIDDEAYNNLYYYLRTTGYLDDKSKVTSKFKDDVEDNKVFLPDEFADVQDEIINFIKDIYLTNNTNLINDERRDNIRTLSPNENFKKQEFQELWKKINYQSVYEVNFDSNELINKCIQGINANLNVAKMSVRITEGVQDDTMSAESLGTGTAFRDATSTTKTAEVKFTPSEIEYDLIGEVTKDTGLTRKTVIEILSNISPSKFDLYKYNPTEFISKASKLINEQKAATIIEGITYHKIDKKFDNSIFTINNVGAELKNDAIEVKKNIYRYLLTDSANERKFASRLEESNDITVYAKLPSGFKIPTPVGNYNPDWAIVFNNPDCKYIYFIAETKGSMSSLELRDVEKAKIACARKHFALISDEKVKYDVVDSYDTLMEKVLN